MKLKTSLLGILVAIGTLFMGTGLIGHADAASDAANAKIDADNLASAQQSMPQGLPLSDYFTIGNFSGVNSAKVQDSTNPNTLGTQAVQLTNGTNQKGSIWAKDAMAFDLSKNEKASMWMYFGDKGDKAGDGMAFVLQNDERGTKAIAVDKNGNPASGETMGVWGYPDDYTSEIGGSSKTASQAIQNSWALEFDTFVNKQDPNEFYDQASDFDLGLSNPHIMADFPANKETYGRKTASVWVNNGVQYYYATTMQHLDNAISGSDSSFLSNGAWHHLSLNWDATTSTMTYTFDDKDPATGAPQTGKTQSQKISASDLGNKTTALWGFTGSTGQNSEDNLVAFEQIPGLVDSSATGTVNDLTQNKVIASGGSVNTNDRLRLDYKLNYNSGSAPWTNIRAHVKVPTGVTPTKGTITYSDGTSSTFDVSGMTNQTIDAKLAQSLTISKPVATVSIYATASSTATTVPSSEGNFYGSNAIASASLNGFTVNKLKTSLLLSTSNQILSADQNEDVEVSGLTSLITTSLFPDKNVVLHPTLNGQDLDTVNDNGGSFTYTVAASDLKPGGNTLTMYATNKYGDVSNDITFQITVGTLDFGKVSAESTFKPTALIGTTQDVLPADDWQIDINDTRSAGHQWTLQASTTPFTTEDGQKLDGQLQYRTDNGDETLSADAINVVTHSTTGDGSTVDVANGWNANSGLHLQVNGGAVEGTYSGKVTWTLNNAPQ
ncbi:lectin-like domain-containing protein [Levilactobacillus tujiorum]|uniref:WxL domain-containing protein n=1 Tax=Levilactobacillus tujiorum TaxID=2912243 RepID=A0ABX1L760_9LACO|nr:WxL domain-containing protein [Levilactobacillus tujiorum]MCH5465088.1 WxL domain-containing protein [Levilactobacillus tujiorum]NLR12641.1 hypothetical protein [Lactobacillus sp. HBUAS51387]NLR30109.1 hypothetical protein [Levilactobacillus tujiorum]